MKSLKPRLITAFFGIVLLVAIMILGEFFSFTIAIVAALASAFMTGEFLHAKNLLKQPTISLPCMIFAISLSLLIMTKYVYILLLVFFLAIFTVLISCHKKFSFMDIAYSVTGTLLISFGMSALYAVCYDGVGVPFFFTAAFAIPWMADAGGFFIGASFGKHKLCPNISPKKTVEGAVGGVIFCLFSSVIIWGIFHFIVMPNVTINVWALALLALIDAPVSILGDLSFSLIKRSLNIKDYGSIFPGHGGMLDRFDSIIFTLPVMYAISLFVPFITLG